MKFTESRRVGRDRKGSLEKAGWGPKGVRQGTQIL